MNSTAPKRIVIVQGHPDPAQTHLCHALAEAYTKGAEAAGHTVSVVTVAAIDFPLLRTQDDWVNGPTPDGLLEAQHLVVEADHMVLLYPLWLGTLPAITKGFLEQALRPSLVEHKAGEEPSFSEFARMMRGTSVRVIVTMGMPAAAYRFFFFAHSLKNLERNILKFVGFKPVRHTLIGMVEDMSPDKSARWFDEMRELGAKGV